MAVDQGDRIAGKVSSLVAVVSRATRRLLSHRIGYADRGVGAPYKVRQPAAAAVAPRDAAAEDECIWRRAILMGERCQPLDFAGAIHYDSSGRRLARPPAPRSASSLSGRSSNRLPLAMYLDIHGDPN